MKIAFLVNNLHVGGLEKVTVEIANILSQKHEVDLLIIESNSNNYKISESIKVLEGQINYKFYEKLIRRVNKETLKLSSLSFFKESKFLNECLRNNEYDFIVASDGYNSMILSYTLRSSQLLYNTKGVGWMHNEYSIYFNGYYKDYKKLLGESLSGLEGLVTLTNKDKQNYGQHNKNVKAIFNPLTINPNQISSLESKEIIFVSRLSREQKGLDYLLEIAAYLKESEWKIRVVGTGEDERWFKEKIAASDLDNTIIMHGVVTQNIEDVYANASIFISTSRWEGFGLSIVEAMACGLPVISFNNAGPSEILSNGEYGILIENYNIKDFGESLLRLINNKELLLEFSQKSLLRSNMFSKESVFNQWEDYLLMLSRNKEELIQMGMD